MIKNGFEVYPNPKKMTDWTEELLVSILMRYPEVTAVNFDPVNQVLKFTFIIDYILTRDEKAKIKQLILDSINVFNSLGNNRARLSKINYQNCKHLTIIELQRDVETIVQEEITLIVGLFQHCLKTSLVTEDNKPVIEEELATQEKMINYLLESVKKTTRDKYLFAFREEGQVLVFDK
jgi:hypothetical protein